MIRLFCSYSSYTHTFGQFSYLFTPLLARTINTTFLFHHSPWQPALVRTLIPLIFTFPPYFSTLLSLLYFLHDVQETRSFLSHLFSRSDVPFLLHSLPSYTFQRFTCLFTLLWLHLITFYSHPITFLDSTYFAIHSRQHSLPPHTFQASTCLLAFHTPSTPFFLLPPCCNFPWQHLFWHSVPLHIHSPCSPGRQSSL